MPLQENLITGTCWGGYNQMLQDKVQEDHWASHYVTWEAPHPGGFWKLQLVNRAFRIMSCSTECHCHFTVTYLRVVHLIPFSVRSLVCVKQRERKLLSPMSYIILSSLSLNLHGNCLAVVLSLLIKKINKRNISSWNLSGLSNQGLEQPFNLSLKGTVGITVLSSVKPNSSNDAEGQHCVTFSLLSKLSYPCLLSPESRKATWALRSQTHLPQALLRLSLSWCGKKSAICPLRGP